MPEQAPRSAYVIRVNVHNLGWDGRVCSSPVSHDDCRAKLDFKSNNCARNLPRCFFLGLFADKPLLHLPRSQAPYQQVFEAQPPKRGDRAVFWATYADGRNWPVGFWTIDRFDDGRDAEFVLEGNSQRSVRFAARTADFDTLAQRVSRSVGADMIRLLSQANLRTVLERFIADHEILADHMRQLGRASDDVKDVVYRLRDAIDELPEEPRFSQRLPIPEALILRARLRPAGSGARAAIAIEPAEPRLEPISADRSLETTIPPPPAAPPEIRFPPQVLADYAVAVKVSPLVVLAGPSGSGKTRLTREFARRAGAAYELVSVRPDWRANEDLLGYLPPFDGDFVATAFTRFVRAAGLEWEAAQSASRDAQPHHCCLDEMNLARPEYYLAEVLSKMELDPDLRLLRLYDAPADRGFPRQLFFPPNLVIVGTVNNDDTTHALSPKVMDRAVYIQVDAIDLNGWFASRPGEAASLVGPLLSELDGILSDTGVRIGYRVAGQVCRWVEEATRQHADRHAALDAALEKLVLSRLRVQRSEPSHREMLDGLIVFLEGYARFAGAPDPDVELLPRSIALAKRLRAAIERREFALGQFET